MRKGILFGVLFMMIGFYSCNKIETPAKNDAAVITLSNSLVVELVSITPCNDGGFVVGARSRKNSHMDFWILKYDNNFNLLWERLVGGPTDDILQKILVDKDDNVLAGGVSDGFGQDSFPLSKDKQDVLYFHYFDKMGNTQWETAYPYIDKNWPSFELYTPIVTDMIEGNETEFIISGRKPHYSNPSTAPAGITIKLTKSGVFSTSYILSLRSAPIATFNAIFKTDETYFVFWHAATMEGVNEFDKSAPSDDKVELEAFSSVPWYGSQIFLDHFTQLKMPLQNGTSSFNYFSSNNVVRFSYDPVLRRTTSSTIPLSFESPYSASTTYDNHFLVNDNTGTIYETDTEFKVLKEYKSDFKHDVLCKLHSGEYVGGFETSNTIFLTHFDTDGKIKTNE